MKILVTGATGFIGKNLIKFIDKNNNEVCLIGRNLKKKSNLKIINTDIYSSKISISEIKKFNPEILIHLAWAGYPEVSKKISKKNLDGQKKFFFNLIKVKSLKKILVTGSCFEYGNLDGQCKENKKITRFSYFSKAKIDTYKFIKKKFSKSCKIMWLRLFYVYGRYQRKGSLIPYLIDSLKKNKKIELKEQFASIDFIYVDDVCKLILKFCDTSSNGIYNIGTGKHFSPYKIAFTLKKFINSKSIIIYDRKKIKSNFYANTEKINKLNFKPKSNLLNNLKYLARIK